MHTVHGYTTARCCVSPCEKDASTSMQAASSAAMQYTCMCMHIDVRKPYTYPFAPTDFWRVCTAPTHADGASLLSVGLASRWATAN